MKITGPFVATQKNKNPGPGAYTSKSTLSKQSYSMNGKNFREDKEKPKLPGPGACIIFFTYRLSSLRNK